jgi:cell division protein FtsX
LAALVGGATLAGERALSAAVAGWRADLRLVAVLREAGGRRDPPEATLAAARALRGVAGVRYVSAELALAELRGVLGPRAEAIGRLPSNPVPARLEITPAADLDAAGLAALQQALARLPRVDEVQAAIGWVEPAERVARGLRQGGLALAALLAVIGLAAAIGAVARARRAGEDETAILRLAGVGETRLAVPLVLGAVGLTTLGTLLGLGALLLASQGGPAAAGPWLRAVFGLGPLPLLPLRTLAMLLAGGVGLGFLAALGGGRP